MKIVQAAQAQVYARGAAFDHDVYSKRVMHFAATIAAFYGSDGIFFF
jgi:hypothetical protein